MGQGGAITAEGSHRPAELLRSSGAFSQYFEDATTVYAVTFCDSPGLLLDFFRKFDLDRAHIIVGDVDDYRERLDNLQNAVTIIDHLERLRREDKLHIYTCPTREVHSKLYLIEHADETVTLINGSPNLTYTATGGRQTNTVSIHEGVPQGATVHRTFANAYETHLDAYAEPFLADLSEALDQSDDPREEVIDRWIEGRTAEHDEVGEVFGRLSEMTETVDAPTEEITLSLQPYESKVQGEVKDRLKDYDISASTNQIRLTASDFGRATHQLFKVPKMWVTEDGVMLLSGDEQRCLTAPPPDDPEMVATALARLEAYFETIDTYGTCSNTTAVQAHEFEALLYCFWAPFINQHARHYHAEGVTLDKHLPHLYIHGESNAGKGKFVKLVLSLLSEGIVTRPIDGDEAKKRYLRTVRHCNTCFPLIFDDITRARLNGADPLRNFWERWTPETRYPAMVFISNDSKPREWFRNRAKILHFDVQFPRSKAGEAAVNAVISNPTPLFSWFAYCYREATTDAATVMAEDFLAPARTAFEALYAHVDRPLPEYFPVDPADRQYDVGKRRWQHAHADDRFTTRETDGELVVQFTDSLESWDVRAYAQVLPEEVRATHRGMRIDITNPDAFWAWLDRPTAESADGPLARIRTAFTRRGD